VWALRAPADRYRVGWAIFALPAGCASCPVLICWYRGIGAIFAARWPGWLRCSVAPRPIRWYRPDRAIFAVPICAVALGYHAIRVYSYKIKTVLFKRGAGRDSYERGLAKGYCGGYSRSPNDPWVRYTELGDIFLKLLGVTATLGINKDRGIAGRSAVPLDTGQGGAGSAQRARRPYYHGDTIMKNYFAAAAAITIAATHLFTSPSLSPTSDDEVVDSQGYPLQHYRQSQAESELDSGQIIPVSIVVRRSVANRPANPILKPTCFVAGVPASDLQILCVHRPAGKPAAKLALPSLERGSL
jgi:hypothetical protein